MMALWVFYFISKLFAKTMYNFVKTKTTMITFLKTAFVSMETVLHLILSSTHSFFQQIFSELLLYTKHSAKW